MFSFLNVQFFLAQTEIQKLTTDLKTNSLCGDVFCYPHIIKKNFKNACNLTRALLQFTEDLLQDEKNSNNISFQPLTLETKSFVLGSIRFPFPKCLLILIAKKEIENEDHLRSWKGFEIPLQHEEKMPLTLMLRCILHRFWQHFFLFHNQETFQPTFSFEILVKDYIADFVPRFFCNPNILKFTLPPFHLFSNTEDKLTRPMRSIINLRLWNFIYQLKTFELLEKKGSIFHSACMFYKDHYMGGTIDQCQADLIYDCLFQSNQKNIVLNGAKKKEYFCHEGTNIPCFYNLCEQLEEIKECIKNATWIGYLYGSRKTKVIKRKTSETLEFVNVLLKEVENDMFVIPKIFFQKNSGLYLIVFKYEEISFLILYSQLPLDDCLTLQNTFYGIFGTSITLSAWFFLLTKFLCDKEFGLPVFLRKIRSTLQDLTEEYNNASSIMLFDNVQKWSNLLFTHTKMPCMNKKQVHRDSIAQKNETFFLHQEKNILWILFNVFNFPFNETLETICVKFKNTQKIILNKDINGSLSYYIGETKTNCNNDEDEFLNKTVLEHF